jgi:ligand-binding sensor domain-containing protein
VFVSDGKAIREEPAFATLKGSAVRSMARTPDGSLWFATSSGVFLCKDGTCNLTLPNIDARVLLAIQSENTNEIWCGTRGNGLLRILLDPVVGPIVSELDSEQGLLSQNVFAVAPQRKADGSDVLLIGTSRGVARYEPGKLEPTLSVTRILSKRVHAPAELQAGLNLEYPQNSLLLDVTAISSRTFPEQFQYAFTLIDSKGQSIKQKLSRESQFTMEGLKPGTYTVTARAFTKDLFRASQFFIHGGESAFPVDLDRACDPARARVAGAAVGHTRATKNRGNECSARRCQSRTGRRPAQPRE